MHRHQFIQTMAGLGAASITLPGLFADEPDKPYVRANTDWLARYRYGIGVHWTAQTVPRHGSPLPFQQAVDAFDVKKFVKRVGAALGNRWRGRGSGR
jgi:hypothetical protein